MTSPSLCPSASLAQRSWGGGRTRPGFTLIEMIIALAIVAILASMALVVGHHVSDNGRKTLTRDMLRILENAQQAYADSGRKVPSLFTDDAGDQFPLVDGRLDSAAAGSPVQASQALFTVATDSATTIGAAAGLSKYAPMTWVHGPNPAATVRDPLVRVVTANRAPQKSGAMNAAFVPAAAGSGIATGNYQLYRIPVFRDPWGKEIRYVHPRFQGVFGDSTSPGNNSPLTVTGKFPSGATLNLARLKSETDGGVTTGSLGYFYSSGPDGDASTRDDNVYLNEAPAQAK